MPALFFQFFGLPIKAKAVKEREEKKKKEDKGLVLCMLLCYSIVFNYWTKNVWKRK